MIISISIGDTIQTVVRSATGENWSPDDSQELQEIIYQLIDHLEQVKPMTSMDKALDYIAQTADPETILTMQGIYPKWAVGVTQKFGMIQEFNGELWQVIYKKTDPDTGEEIPWRSQADWLPPDVPALYKRVLPEGEIAPWRQPQGKHDAYRIGDKVTHNDHIWECTDGNMDEELGVKLNVWEPGVYGWTQVE